MNAFIDQAQNNSHRICQDTNTTLVTLELDQIGQYQNNEEKHEGTIKTNNKNDYFL